MSRKSLKAPAEAVTQEATEVASQTSSEISTADVPVDLAEAVTQEATEVASPLEYVDPQVDYVNGIKRTTF